MVTLARTEERPIMPHHRNEVQFPTEAGIGYGEEHPRPTGGSFPSLRTDC